MITLDDWSELITIDYYGGMSGDFFGLLLHDAIYKDTLYNPTNENKFDFNPYDVLSSTNKEGKSSHRLRHLYYYKTKFYNYKFNKYDLYDTQLSETYNNIFKKKLNFSDEYRNYVYENYGHKFDGTFKMSLFHDTDVNELNLKYKISLPDIFPKSKNIMLICPDHYMFFVNFLEMVKNVSQKNFLENNAKIKSYIDNRYNKFTNFRFYIFNDYPCLKLDMYSFLYEQKNYDKELSNLLGQEIILNKEKIAEYAQKNIELLNQYGLDINCVYSKKYFIDKVDSFFEKILSSKV